MPAPPDPALPPIQQLRDLVATLRAPGGCPWDREQTHRTLRSGLIEEAYEVATAIDTGDDANLREELGDLLLQVVFHAQLSAEDGRFDFDQVALGIVEKLVRRHPHVFAAESASDSAAVLVRWDEIKRAEKAAAGADATAPSSLLDGIPGSLPALLHAFAAQKKAGKVGFDWDQPEPIVEKIREELQEVIEAVSTHDDAAIEHEIGDLLFSVVNLARKLRVDPEIALRGSTDKFSNRFRAMEKLAAARSLDLEKLTLAEMDLLWDEVKRDAAPLAP